MDTDYEIKIIASRYNLGPDIKKEGILTGYGDEIYKNQNEIMKALE